VAAKCVAVLAFLLLAPAGPTAAEHEVYYRFTVLGYVKDAAGQPRAGLRLELTRERTGFSYLGETDRAGFYVITARLGDESVGERLRLRAGDQMAVVTARFDPADRRQERGTRVDFLGAGARELAAAFPATLARFLAR